MGPGDLVVCVGYDKADGHAYVPPEDQRRGVIPTRGCVYTIATINDWPRRGVTLVTLVECDNKHLTRNGWEPGFDARGFRPITRDRLEIFRSILRDVPVDDKVSA